MLRYLSGRLMDGDLSGNGFIDVTVDLLSETQKYLKSIPGLNLTKLDNSMKYQLLQCIGSLLKYLTSIESIQIEYFSTRKSKFNKNGVYVNLEKKPLERVKSVDDSKRLLVERGGSSEEIAKQSEPQSNAGKFKFILNSLKLTKKSRSSGNSINALPGPGGKKNYEPQYSNSPMLQHKDIVNKPMDSLRKYHSTDNLSESIPQASIGFRVKDLGDTCDIHTYDLSSMTRSRLSYSDSDNDMESYIQFDNSCNETMPLNDTDEQVAKIRLKVNVTELGERVCVLRDSTLLIGKELDGFVAEYTCALTQYSLDHQICNESNNSLCISYNDVNMFLAFKSEEICNKWKEDIKKNMLKVRYISIYFSNKATDFGYECIKDPIYERISLLTQDSVDICEGEKSTENDK